MTMTATLFNGAVPALPGTIDGTSQDENRKSIYTQQKQAHFPERLERSPGISEYHRLDPSVA